MRLWTWIIAITFSLGLYWYWGAGDQVILAHQIKKEVKKIKTEVAKTGSMRVLIERLKTRVDQTPDDPKGWFLLGNLYLNNQQIDEAVNSFAKANNLKPNDVDIMTKYAEALFLKNNRKINKEAQLLIDKVLKNDLQNINALNMIAIDAFQRGDKKTAKEYWKKVLIQLPIDSDDAKQIETMMQIN